MPRQWRAVLESFSECKRLLSLFIEEIALIKGQVLNSILDLPVKLLRSTAKIHAS